MRLGILGVEVVAHDARPHAACGAELRHLFQEIAMRVEEERQPRRELVDIEPGINRRLHVGHAVGQRERHFLHCRRAGLAHVVAGDRDGVPLRHVLVGVRKNVGDNAHRLRRRIDIRSARDVLLQHIVLNCARKLGHFASGALGSDDVQRQQNRCGRVDGHRGGDLLQVDAVEQAHHVVDGVDRHADLANLAHGERVVGVEPDLRRQIEGNAQAGGSLAQQIFVAPVRFVGIAHARVLPHGPQTAAIHGRLHAAGVGELSRVTYVAVVIPRLEIGRRVQRMNGNV